MFLGIERILKDGVATWYSCLTKAQILQIEYVQNTHMKVILGQEKPLG